MLQLLNGWFLRFHRLFLRQHISWSNNSIEDLHLINEYLIHTSCILTGTHLTPQYDCHRSLFYRNIHLIDDSCVGFGHFFNIRSWLMFLFETYDQFTVQYLIQTQGFLRALNFFNLKNIELFEVIQWFIIYVYMTLPIWPKIMYERLDMFCHNTQWVYYGRNITRCLHIHEKCFIW